MSVCLQAPVSSSPVPAAAQRSRSKSLAASGAASESDSTVRQCSYGSMILPVSSQLRDQPHVDSLPARLQQGNLHHSNFNI
jgi:hypothetical protein